MDVQQESGEDRLFLLSAADKAGLHGLASKLRKYLVTHNDEGLLDDIAYTLSKRPKRPCKSYVIANSISQLEHQLGEDVPSRETTTRSPGLGFVFTGSGSQYYRMGQQFLVHPTFKDSLDDATAYMKDLGSPWLLTDEMFHNGDQSIHDPGIAQAACAALQVALVDLLASWNIFPSHVIGHSAGETAAAYCAGKISREAAWKISYYRGQVVAKQSRGGTMMAVGLGHKEVQSYIDKVDTHHTGLSIGCFNSPRNVTVCGDEALIDELKKVLDANGVFARKVNVCNAFHSERHMKDIRDEYLQLMEPLPSGKFVISNPEIQMFSPVTGKRVEETSLPPSYWVDSAAGPVHFEDGVRSMFSTTRFDKDSLEGSMDIIEVGPHPTMRSAIQETVQPSVSYMSLLNRRDPTRSTALDTVGTLASKSACVNMYEVNHSHPGYDPQLLSELLPQISKNEKERSSNSTDCSRRKYRSHSVQDWWKPDGHLLTDSAFHSLVPGNHNDADGLKAQFSCQIQLASILLITDALGQLRNRPERLFEGHLQRYYEWMKMVAADLLTDSLALVPLKQWSRYAGEQKIKESLYESIQRTARGRLLVRMGANIQAVLLNEVEPRYLMFEKDGLVDSYSDALVAEGDISNALSPYLSIMRDSSPRLRVLELESGTGSFTKHVLSSLCPRSESTSPVMEYTVTDPSDKDFLRAEDRLERWQDILSFQKLDITEKPAAQGFVDGYYDMVIAANSFHTVPDLQEALKHARSLLKPGGKLVIQEGVRHDLLWAPLVFGQLPTWWDAVEPMRRWSPYITVPEWDVLLRQCGFSGIDLEMPSAQDPTINFTTAMVSTALEDRISNESVVLLCDNDYLADTDVAQLQHELLSNQKIKECSAKRPEEVSEQDLTDSVCISLLELPHSISLDNQEEFASLHRILSTCKQLLWVTGEPVDEPTVNTSTSLIRTARWERELEEANLVTLAASNFGPFSVDTLFRSISSVCQYQFLTQTKDHANAEYLLHGDVIYTRTHGNRARLSGLSANL